MAAVVAERHCFAAPIAAEPDPAPAGSGLRALDAEPWVDLTAFGEHNDLTERTLCVSCPLPKLKAIVVHGLEGRFDPDLPLRADSEHIRK
jgi:hypothetical protein